MLLARTTIPDLTAERLENRLSQLLGRAQAGSEMAPLVIENAVWTIQTCGFDRQVTSDLLSNAAKQAEMDPQEVIGQYLPAERSIKRSRRDGTG